MRRVDAESPCPDPRDQDNACQDEEQPPPRKGMREGHAYFPLAALASDSKYLAIDS